MASAYVIVHTCGARVERVFDGGTKEEAVGRAMEYARRIGLVDPDDAEAVFFLRRDLEDHHEATGEEEMEDHTLHVEKVWDLGAWEPEGGKTDWADVAPRAGGKAGS